jgi:putative dehydrogenase
MSSTSMPKVAFVGLGAMGIQMAQTLKAGGYDVRGFDIRPEVVKAFHQDDPIKCSKSVSEAAKGANIIILMVISHVQAHSILFTADGIGALKELAEGADILLMATCSQEASIQLARQVSEQRPDVGFVDAPVSGGVEGAKTGNLTIMAAAKDEVFQRVEPILKIMGSKLYHVGTEVGQGSAMKAVNQVSPMYRSFSLLSTDFEYDRCYAAYISLLQLKLCHWQASRASIQHSL